MRATTDLVFGVTGQTLAHRVQQGRATSATFKVFRDYANDDAVPEFSGTAVVDTVNTTVSVTSGGGTYDPTILNLTSTTGIVTGRKYLLSQASQNEWVDPIRIEAGYIVCRHPIVGSYSLTVATLVGTSLTATVDATWVANVSNISDHADPNPDYRVRWDILVNGATVVHYSYFDLTRGTVTHQVEVEDLDARAPGLIDSLPVEWRNEQARPLIDAAWRSVQAKLASIGLDSDAIRDNQAIDELTIMKSLNMLAQGGWHPAGMSTMEYVEVTRTDYDRFVEQHFQVTLSHAVAKGSGSGADRGAQIATPFWSK